MAASLRFFQLFARRVRTRLKEEGHGFADVQFQEKRSVCVNAAAKTFVCSDAAFLLSLVEFRRIVDLYTNELCELSAAVATGWYCLCAREVWRLIRLSLLLNPQAGRGPPPPPRAGSTSPSCRSTWPQRRCSCGKGW